MPRPADRQRDVDFMRELLKSKSRQCKSFRHALRSSGTTTILHSTYAGKGEEFWGTGLDHRDKASHGTGEFPGKNWLGVLLMEIRGDLAQESEYETTRIDAAHLNGVVVILNDGEILDKPQNVNYIVNRTYNCRNSSCFLCGENGHNARVCRLRNKGFSCYRCGQYGHKMANCTNSIGPHCAVARPLFARNVPRPMGF